MIGEEKQPLKCTRTKPQLWKHWSQLSIHPGDQESFVNTDWEVTESSFWFSLSSAKPWTLYFLQDPKWCWCCWSMDHSLRSTGLEWTYLVCLGSCLTNKSQLLGISEFPSRVNPNLPFLLEDPVLSAIAKKHKQTPALVALRYQIQRGVVVLAKSYNKKRIKENIQVMRGTVGRGLLGSILHEGHSLSSSQTIFGPKRVTWSFPVCECLVVFSSWCGNRRGDMAGEG